MIKLTYQTNIDDQFGEEWAEENVNYIEMEIGDGADLECLVRNFNSFLIAAGFEWLKMGEIKFVPQSESEQEQLEFDIDGC